ncbi:MAG: tyrosine--tRNA ligase [bacterium]|nr:tyrosine--tRNA ligase [bacterium]
MDKIGELLTRGVANVIASKEKLEKLLRSGKKLNIYIGIDPTSPQIHLGHAVPLRKLQQFAQLGHNVIFLIGDFTALIGDTSDKDTERPILSHQQIEQNFQTYKKQAEKILDFSKVNVRHNSEWLKELTFEKIIKLCQHFSLGDFIGRELIKRRLEDGKRVGLQEVLYPIIQGYDSYFLDTDVQIGGTDQTFNMQAGRSLQKDLRSKESFVLATKFLIGTDERKMSKTWGNAIWLNDSPNDMYAKIMAVNDDLIIEYYTLASTVDLSKIEKIKKELEDGKNPMLVKKELAHEIVSELYGKKQADDAAENFEKVVQKKAMPQEITEFKITGDVLDFYDLIVKIGFASSRGEAKRLIDQGGISVDGKNVKENDYYKVQNNSILENTLEIHNQSVIQVGKRRFVRIKI